MAYGMRRTWLNLILIVVADLRSRSKKTSIIGDDDHHTSVPKSDDSNDDLALAGGAMPGLDFFTISIVVGALAVVNAVALLMVWRLNPSVPGLGVCSLSQCLHVAAWLLSVMSFQSVITGSGYTVLNNALSLSAMLLLLEGVLRFRGFGNPIPRRYLILIGIALVTGISVLNRDDVTRRYLWHDAICIVVLTSAAFTMMWRAASHERIVHGMTAAFILLITMAAWSRWTIALIHRENPSFDFVTFNAGIFTVVAISGLGWVCGMMLSVNMRVRQQVLLVTQIDPLTGLSNRRQLETVLTRAFARQQRGGAGFAIAFFDLDRFKSINDRYGHQGGDAVLMTVADRLRDFLRNSDDAARFGGDEFVVLFNNVSTQAELDRACERLRLGIEGPVVLGNDIEPVNISLGAALAPRDGQDNDALLRHADTAMYADKRLRQTASPPDDGPQVIPFPTLQY